MKPYINLVPNTWLPESFKKGWGNGYVILPKDHPFHGCDYDFLNSFVTVHGGLTYSQSEDNGHDGWSVGFDTAHYADTIERWPYEAVKKEAIDLLEQLIHLGEKYTREEVEQMLNDRCDV